MIISPSVPLRGRNVSEEMLYRKSKQILCSIISSKNRGVCETMWKNIVEPERPQI
jgi:hypothetical protein